jgi:hypothetical protein
LEKGGSLSDARESSRGFVDRLKARNFSLELTVFVRGDPFLIQSVEVADCRKVVVRDVDSSFCDVEEIVGGVDMSLCGRRVRGEVRNRSSSRTEVDLLSSSLKKENVVEDAESLGRL